MLVRFFAVIFTLSSVAHASVVTTATPFQISTLNTKWYESPLPQGQINLAALYRAPEVTNGVQATLSVRIDEPPSEPSREPSGEPLNSRGPASLDLNRYSQKWLNDFPRFGFKVLKTETRTINGDPVVVADLQDNTNDRRQRQMLRTNGKQVAILTCTDSKAKFAQSSKNCDLLMNTFRWVNPPVLSEGLRHSPATE